MTNYPLYKGSDFMLLQGKRIFYVEDDVKNKTITQLILEQGGATFAFARWGTDVVVKIKEYMPVDLILLDLMLPHGVTGYDVFDAIRCVPQLLGVPVVAVSASDPSIEIPRTRAKGFDGFIGKPIDLRMFPQQICDILNGKPIWYAR